MGRINYARVALGALVAGVIYFVCDGIIHGALLGADYQAAMDRVGMKIEEDPTSYGYFALFDYGKGLVALLFYAAMRARIGPGVKTAVVAGLIAWFATEAVPAIGVMSIPFMTKWFYVKLMGLTVVPMILGAIAGAWLYREREAS